MIEEKPALRYRCKVEGYVFKTESHWTEHVKRQHLEIVETRKPSAATAAATTTAVNVQAAKYEGESA